MHKSPDFYRVEYSFKANGLEVKYDWTKVPATSTFEADVKFFPLMAWLRDGAAYAKDKDKAIDDAKRAYKIISLTPAF